MPKGIKDCATCEGFNRSQSSPVSGNVFGFCHRYPPSITNPENKTSRTEQFAFPSACSGQWCGEYKKSTS